MLIVKNLNHTKLLFDMSKYTLHRKRKFQVTLLEKTRGKTMKKLMISIIMSRFKKNVYDSN